MLTNSWRQFRSQAIWGLALVLLAPAFVQAQQTGLFPMRTIRRERVPCPNEDPVYKLYRHEYFGYHPTCWRRFPANWGCPSPEQPDAARSFNELKRKPPVDVGGGQPGDQELAPAPGGRGERPDEAPMPAIPGGGRSPFEPDEAGPGGNPPRDGGGVQPTNPQPLGPSSSVSPLGAPRTAQANELPSLPAEPAQGSGAGGPVNPMLALPEAAAPDASLPPLPAPIESNAAPANVSPDPSAAPAQAPKRRSLIGGLFNALGVQRR